jgi:hypothetical protein
LSLPEYEIPNDTDWILIMIITVVVAVLSAPYVLQIQTFPPKPLTIEKVNGARWGVGVERARERGWGLSCNKSFV